MLECHSRASPQDNWARETYFSHFLISLLHISDNLEVYDFKNHCFLIKYQLTSSDNLGGCGIRSWIIAELEFEMEKKTKPKNLDPKSSITYTFIHILEFWDVIFFWFLTDFSSPTSIWLLFLEVYQGLVLRHLPFPLYMLGDLHSGCPKFHFVSIFSSFTCLAQVSPLSYNWIWLLHLDIPHTFQTEHVSNWTVDLFQICFLLYLYHLSK